MEKLKSFKQFLNENLVDGEQNVQIDEFIEDDYIDTTDELDNIDSEEMKNILQIKYNKEDEEWELKDNFESPEDFEHFYEWFIDMDEENTLASMKEDDDEVVFYLPENLYLEYLEEQSIEPDEESLDDEDENDDDYDEEWTDEE